MHTEHNPADIATRPVSAEHLRNTIWFTGPSFLAKPQDTSVAEQTFELLEPECDPELRQVTNMATVVSQHLGSHRFNSFSCWSAVVRAIGALIHIIQCFKKKTD